jgi:hypothetical protein
MSFVFDCSASGCTGYVHQFDVLGEGGMKASWEDISRTLAFCSSNLWRIVILLLQLFTDYSQQPLLCGRRERRVRKLSLQREV